ncbi:SDR family NAD(P)-dependent oxidoreductase [Arthrobacter sp. KBS0702]|uniref:oxidoreductase n=1 Tax=Arthrobacter sp. KBS0702 TaxID=2578107 RepID=UPI00110E18B2|nr:oxidoreductase [Arthrobacter sp. KBS0702]QDW29190.1 SDR family NAD(P)-dependent oxidoreductase [Arthrobacter sp. KBS0702]
MTTAVLITGASSGIGRATAERLLKRPGFTVYATARRTDALTGLADAGATVLALDVTDEASMAAAVRTVEERHGSVGVLINNAGYGEYGTIEEADLDAVRRQFETNVFGFSRMIQLVLPGMRAAGAGRIINIGSMGGRVTFPVGGYYHATKYAVEAITDALRFETAPFGIHTSLIAPGLIRTGFGATAARTLASSGQAAGPYAALRAAADEQMAVSYASPVLAAEPDAVAVAVEHAATARRPRTRYTVTPAAKAIVQSRRFLGSGLFDAYLRLQFRSTK